MAFGPRVPGLAPGACIRSEHKSPGARARGLRLGAPPGDAQPKRGVDSKTSTCGGAGVERFAPPLVASDQRAGAIRSTPHQRSRLSPAMRNQENACVEAFPPVARFFFPAEDSGTPRACL